MNLILKSLLLGYLILFSAALFSQSPRGLTLSGSVRDESSGEALIGATVRVKDQPVIGAVSNAYGYYAISVPAGTYTLLVSYVGYQTLEMTLAVSRDTTVQLQLNPAQYQMEEVVIEYKQDEKENVVSAKMGVTKLEIAEMAKIPVIFGEKDIIKTVQLLPGVKSAGEGNSGFFVRGGGADQNLVLLDEAPVYNASHLLGFFSVFNSDALKDVTLIKGGMPAEYGGRLSSVMDVRMKDGNNKKYGVTGGIGLISSRLTVEGPIVKEKGSFMASGRRTYADLFLKLLQDSTLSQSKLYFYDLNLKANYRFGDKNQVYLSGYFGRDNFGFGNTFNFDWGNQTATLRWNHLFSNRLFSNTTFIYSDYDYQIKLGLGETGIKITSGIQDYNVKQDFQFYANGKNTLKFGVNAIHHTFVPGVISIDNDTTELGKKYALEYAAYLSHEWSASDRFKINYGLRLSAFQSLGNDDMVYTYSPEGTVTDSVVYGRDQVFQSYGGIEPRLSASYVLTENSSVKASYMRTYQYMHLLSNSSSGTPTDLWIPSSNNVKPEIADQISLGYFRNFDNNNYEFSAEAYYKDLQNQIDYRNGAELEFNSKVEADLLFGDGRAYGLELFLKKRNGRLNGWISYTLSRTERQIEGINGGAYYPARQDRTHDLSVVAIYDLNKRISLSGLFVYYTGNAVTFPSGRAFIDGQWVNTYSDRNAERMPAYHRLDLAVTVQGKARERFESSWNFSLYNAYGRKNAYSISFQASETNPNQSEAVRLALFRWIPSVTYNFTF